MTKIPIIIFDSRATNQFYNTIVRQAHKRNPETTDIHIIQEGVRPVWTDKTNNVKSWKIGNYEKSELSRLFKQFYPQSGEHLSTNNRDFEFWCFYRWFVIREFVKEHSIDRFFCMDSDVLLYCDINKEAKNFKKYRWTTTNRVSAGISFINDIGVLDKFCELTNAIWSGRDKFHYNKLLYHFTNLQQNGRAGGANDMSVFEVLAKDAYYNPGEVGETSEIFYNTSLGTTFDHNLNASDGYMMDVKNNIKLIKWHGNNPFCYNFWREEWVKMNCLHLQGQFLKTKLEEFIK